MLFFSSFPAGLSYYYLCGNLSNIAIMWGIKKFFIDEDKILAMLMPEQLKAPSSFFLEEADLDIGFEKKNTKGPKTVA